MNPKTIGRYEIQGVLGEGAMAVVFKAFDPRLERYAAIKLMKRTGNLDEELQKRFFQEARSAAKLNHPNIIAIYDLGEDPKQPFIAMEYLEGQDLRSVIQNREHLSTRDRLGFIVQVCDALDYAHRNGIVHRDIKPGNVYITRNGSLKILDFGLARLSSSEMTQSGMIMGSPYYMSPEQVKGQRDIDGRSDLFSLGVMFYELISYQRPFEGDTPTSVCFQIVSEPHAPITNVLPGCHPELIHITDRALAKDRETRFQTGAEFKAALLAFEEKLVQVQEELQGEIEALESRLKDVRRKSKGVPDSASETGPESAAGEPDYCALLLRHADLKQQIEAAGEAGLEAGEILELIERARQALKEEKLEDCQGMLREIFKVDPENSEAGTIQGSLTNLVKRQETQLRVKTALAVARSALSQGNFEACNQATTAVLEIVPSHAEAKQLQEQAAKKENPAARESDPEAHKLILRRDRERQVDELLDFAESALKREDFAAALGNLTFLLEVEPDNEDALELKAQSEQSLEKAGPAAAAEVASSDATMLFVESDSPQAVEAKKKIASQPRSKPPLEAEATQLAQPAEATRILERAEGSPTAEPPQEMEATGASAKTPAEAAAPPAEAAPEPPAEEEIPETAAAEVEEKLSEVVLAQEPAPETVSEPALEDTMERDFGPPTAAPPATVSAIFARPWLLRSLAALILLLLVIGLGTWWMGPGAGLSNGSLVLDVAPWARVESITELDSGESIPLAEQLSTPCTVPLPAGRYQVRVSNPHLGDPLEFEVSIMAGEPSVVHQKIPAFDLERELTAILKNPGS